MNWVKIRREFVNELWQISWTFSHHSLNFWQWVNPGITTVSCRNVKYSLNLPSWETCVILSPRESKTNAISSARLRSYLVTSLDDFCLNAHRREPHPNPYWSREFPSRLERHHCHQSWNFRAMKEFSLCHYQKFMDFAWCFSARSMSAHRRSGYGKTLYVLRLRSKVDKSVG
jgi:hypothetical protein